MEDYKKGLFVARIAIVVNVILCAFKITAGIIGKSSAMLADGVHTLSDVFATSVALIGIKLASKEADDDHQYGHERYEPLFAKVISTILIITGFSIGYGGIKTLINGDIQTPARIALLAAGISIAAKEALYWNTIKVAREIGSISLEADAWHHRSDAISSVGAFIGILGARLGIKVLDPMAGIIVSILIIKLGIEFWLRASKGLLDVAAPLGTIKRIKEVTMEVEGVEKINSLKTRLFANKLYVDIDIAVDGKLTVQEGHDIATKVHDNVEKEIEEIKHCMIHVDPYIEDSEK